MLIFRDADLRECSFIGTDLRKAVIRGVEWPEITFRWWRFTFSKQGIGVYDENELKKGDTHSLAHIERLYRELKQNYEDRRDYDKARDFHYGEKQMRRKNFETPWGRRFFLWMYWLVSGYGERWLRPLLWFGGLLLLSTCGYPSLGGVHYIFGRPLVWTNGWDIFDSAVYSVKVMTLLKPDDLVPVGPGKVINTVQSVLGPVLIGLFALALRQRLKR